MIPILSEVCLANLGYSCQELDIHSGAAIPVIDATAQAPGMASEQSGLCFSTCKEIEGTTPAVPPIFRESFPTNITAMLAAQVYEVHFWQMHYGKDCPKRTLVLSNLRTIDMLDRGVLTKAEKDVKHTLETTRTALAL